MPLFGMIFINNSAAERNNTVAKRQKLMYNKNTEKIAKIFNFFQKTY